jgi:putative FmdB family regulatory protein
MGAGDDFVHEGLVFNAIRADSAASVFLPVPTYEYKCPNGHVFEVFKRIADPAPEACATCGASPVETVLYPVPVHFRGSGFYSTDYGRGGRKREGSKESTDSDSGSGEKGEKKDKPPEKKAAEA